MLQLQRDDALAALNAARAAALRPALARLSEACALGMWARGVWVLLPGASRHAPGLDRVGRLRESPRPDGTAEVRWADVAWTMDGGGGSVERVAAAALREAPGTTAGLDYHAGQASWGQLTAAQQAGCAPAPPSALPSCVRVRALCVCVRVRVSLCFSDFGSED